MNLYYKKCLFIRCQETCQVCLFKMSLFWVYALLVDKLKPIYSKAFAKPLQLGGHPYVKNMCIWKFPHATCTEIIHEYVIIMCNTGWTVGHKWCSERCLTLVGSTLKNKIK